MVPEVTIQTSKGEKQLAVLPCYKTYKPQPSLVQHDNSKGAVVGHIIGNNNSFLVGFMNLTTRGKSCLVLKT